MKLSHYVNRNVCTQSLIEPHHVHCSIQILESLLNYVNGWIKQYGRKKEKIAIILRVYSTKMEELTMTNYDPSQILTNINSTLSDFASEVVFVAINYSTKLLGMV